MPLFGASHDRPRQAMQNPELRQSQPGAGLVLAMLSPILAEAEGANMTPKLTIAFNPDGGFTWHMDAGARAADIIAALETVKASLVRQLLASMEAARVVAQPDSTFKAQ